MICAPCSGSSTSSELTAADQLKAGIPPGYLRISVGITGTLEQRWAQLEEAVRSVLGLGAPGAEPQASIAAANAVGNSSGNGAASLAPPRASGDGHGACQSKDTKVAAAACDGPAAQQQASPGTLPGRTRHSAGAMDRGCWIGMV